jgi:hypothetical protein
MEILHHEMALLFNLEGLGARRLPAVRCAMTVEEKGGTKLETLRGFILQEGYRRRFF